MLKVTIYRLKMFASNGALLTQSQTCLSYGLSLSRLCVALMRNQKCFKFIRNWKKQISQQKVNVTDERRSHCFRLIFEFIYFSVKLFSLLCTAVTKYLIPF